VLIHAPDGTVEHHTKVTGLHVPEGARIEVRTGGGASFGPPEQRPADEVRADIDAGYLTEAGARACYPHAF
jgi:N-methylhydantoinase B